MNNRLLVPCLLCCFLLSCNKEAEKYHVPESFKEWALFQSGSYWIYLNENSGKIDSSFIYSGPSTWFYEPAGDGKLYEIISYHISGIGEFRLGAKTDQSILLIQGIFPGGTYVLTSLVTSDLSNLVSPTCWVVKRYDSLTVNDQLFFEVIHTRDTFSNSTNDYYIAKKTGLIKFAIKNSHGDSAWSLVRYHVVQ
jgi:hypothetical protein